MSKRSDLVLLEDIHTAITRILTYTKRLSYQDFIEDYKTQDAVVRNLEIIGEATKDLCTELKLKYHDIPWSKMAKQRDRLIHHYAGVDYDVIWAIIDKSLPDLLPKIQNAIEHEKKPSK